MKTLNEWTKEDLLQLPERTAQNLEGEYSSILVLSRLDIGSVDTNGTVVIGIAKGEPVELAATHSEFVDWEMATTMPVAGTTLAREMAIRSTALMQSGAFHVWKPGARVRVAVFPNQTKISFVAI